MGFLDHAKTWTFTLGVAPDECIRLFTQSLAGRNGAFLSSEWSVTVSGGGVAEQAIATYEGRAAGPAPLPERARREQSAAIGSRMRFTAVATAGGTRCTMQMIEVAKVYLVVTADARFFRVAMDRVARRLRDRDAGLELVKA